MYESVKRRKATSQAALPHWSAPAPVAPRPEPVEVVQRALTVHTFRPISMQRRAAQPVLQASHAKTGMLTAARGYAVETVAQQAVVWVTGFLATGGLGPVAKAAFSLVSTFLQNAQTFGQVGAGVLNSVQDIAAGQTVKAAQTVEQNLGRVTGLVLKFVSKLLGLDKIGGALRRGLTAVQKPINTAIDKIVGSKPVQAVFQNSKLQVERPRRIQSRKTCARLHRRRQL